MVPLVTQIGSNFPVSLMVGLRDTFGLKRFIETGTNRGDTALLASLAFPFVDTVDIDSRTHAQAVNAFRGLPNVRCHCSDSVQWLTEILPPIKLLAPTLFYLDAHGPGNFPLEAEFKVLGGLHGQHCIVADDNRLEHVRPYVVGWDYFGFETQQFCVLCPRPCEYQAWKLDRPWFQF